MAGLIIFIKNPELGKCKTRLAATIGDEKALIVYKNLLQHTKEVALSISLDRFLFYAESVNHNDAWSNNKFNKQLQHQGDLGDRMNAAFSLVLSTHSKAVIIGSDCPEINTDVIEKAYNALDNSDYVIGPTHDGGYYLLGMKEPSSFLFMNMKWSVESVFDETVERIKKENKTFEVLQILSDLDYEEDLNNFPSFKLKMQKKAD